VTCPGKEKTLAKRTTGSKALGAAIAAIAGATVGLLGTKKGREKVPVWVGALLGVGTGGATLAVPEGVARDSLLGASGGSLAVVGGRVDEMIEALKKDAEPEAEPDEGLAPPP
jgi:hypothetical protein